MEAQIKELFNRKFNGESINIQDKLNCTDEEYDVLLREYLSSKENEKLQEKTLTGYPSIDKPWEKYYRTIPIRKMDTNQSIYNLIRTNNQNNMNLIALGYYGKKITYRELFEKVDILASAYLKNGVKKGDVVLLSVINTPEAAINLLALNKIGAISKWVDIRASKEQFIHYINEHECKTIVIFDDLAEKIDDLLDETNVKKVITISPLDSLSVEKKLIVELKNKLAGENKKRKKSDIFTQYNDFFNSGEANYTFEEVQFDKNDTSVIVQSSGTTGLAKSIEHSNYSITSFAQKIGYSDLPLYEKKKLLILVPPWVAYGLIDSLYLSLAYGMQAQLYPSFEPEAMYNNRGKFNICFAAPFHCIDLAQKADKLSESNRKMIDCIISGGDKLSVEQLEYIEKQLGIQVVNGYGNNEGLGAVTFNPYSNNKFGSLGIPKYGDTIISYDSDSEKELKYNNVGELCYQSTTSFLKYSNNEEQTKLVKRTHDDDKQWIHTGDLGYIDDEGYVHFVGRKIRVIVRLGFKLSPYTIEEAISKHEAVDSCITVGVPDESEGTVPYSFIQLKDDYCEVSEQVLHEIEELCNQSLKENEIPKYFKIISKIPVTDNNKYDFKKLEQLANDDISNDVNSNNMILRK